MKKIIAISGKQYCGKDTIAKLILEKFKNFKRVGIGDAIKIEYGKKNCLTFEEIEKNKSKYRKDLIELGNYGRSLDEDYWLKALINLDYDIVVPDIRVLHELELFKSHGAFLLRVEADEKTRAKRGIITNSDDLTETMLDDYKSWDFVQENNGTFEDLENSVNSLFEAISKYIS